MQNNFLNQPATRAKLPGRSPGLGRWLEEMEVDDDAAELWERLLAELTPGPCAACGVRPGEGGHSFRRCKRCRNADYCSGM
jgi:hypothetical protein